MLLDIIYLRHGHTLFRASGDHEYAAGRDDVLSISQVRAPKPFSTLGVGQPLVKNLCGKFKTYFREHPDHLPVLKKPRNAVFGRHKVMHHVHGTVSVYSGVAFFKGCCGYRGIAALSEDLFLEDPVCEVHMGVFKTYLGRHLQTCHGCYMERAVERRFRCIRVCQRLDEDCQAVKLQVLDFDPAELPHLAGSLAPTSLDIKVTNTGVVLLRFSWGRCTWTPDAEAAVLCFCSWMAGQLRECC
jgi:hypothetical protein